MKLLIDISDEDYEFIKDLKSVVIGGRGNTKTVQYNVINAIKNGVLLNMPPIKVKRVEYETDEMPYRMWVSNGYLMEIDNESK